MSKILYIDMDSVLVDFKSVIERLELEERVAYKDNLDDVPGIFALMDPVEDAIESYHDLAGRFDTYVLSTAPWNNPSAWSDKLHWVKKHLGAPAHKRLILTHHKNLNIGDYLIDDRVANGAGLFTGEHIQFATEQYPDWKAVITYLNGKEN